MGRLGRGALSVASSVSTLSAGWWWPWPEPKPDAAMAGVYDVVIVGGGLCGLMLARLLEQQGGVNYVVLEAHEERFGGRLWNTPEGLDLGAAWLWPQFGQTHAPALSTSLGLELFPQPPGEPKGFAPPEPGRFRVEGGTYGLVERIVAGLPAERVRKGCPVTCVRRDAACPAAAADADKTYVALESSDGGVFHAERVVLAVPPEMLAAKVEFEPALPQARMRAMRNAKTWMAGVTKVVLAYEARFWEDLGLGLGAAGPAFQVYDASSKDDGVVGITFFAFNEEDLDDDEFVGPMPLTLTLTFTQP
uniref:monoamine oxidase n=2 Tax=Phaeomonas parva TaxID=124430 RepID=A0A7S1UDZ2_9STRA|mmetsp:Transcript_40501/g.126698  ORF Transcript_40501/g.126698 Transcript_40501/m.126698 type:complete len:305 (+) Transcript_40501:140-1054(+)